MTVVFGSMWQPTPGRVEEVIAAMARAKSVHKRLGADVHAYQLSAAGPLSGHLLYLMEYAGGEAYGTSIKAMLADAEWQTFTAEVLNSPTPIARLVNQAFTYVVPELDGIGMDPGTPGPRVRAMYRWTAKPGRGLDGIQLLAELRPIVEAEGARTRTVQFLFSGPEAGALTTVLEFDDIVAFGAFQDRTAGNMEFQEKVVTPLLAADSPLQFVGAMIATEVPI